MTAIDFWLSLGSPPSYLASARIDEIAARHGRELRWRPFDIRAMLEREGIRPNVTYPRKGPYARRDWERTARLRGTPFRVPDPFPRPSAPAMVTFYAIENDAGPDAAKAFARDVMAAYFVDNAPIDEPATLARFAAKVGVRAVDEAAGKAALEAATAEADGSGVWGAPFVIVDGEPFWGEDRLDQVDLWLERGGW